MEIYEDNAAMVWKLVWVVDGVKQKEHGNQHHLSIRPFIKFHEPENESFTLLEVNCCPPLKVNREARAAALRDNRYASVPVLGKKIRAIVKQSLDFFNPDEASLFRLVQGWGSAPGPVNSITLADDMSFVRNVIMRQSSFETKITKGENYTLSPVIFTF
ncbi:hypothetical protein QC764_0075270 [Podospora pseudoanserina]|uniref:Uncharacterized protein n=1 Tax=Podospora pseudoanserina TaxID=2609844 RepID=A0ABR0I469_9PEZI|nr:hypothetical protein QC764_0075270 [Podospora pseudoanserina]